MTGQTDASEVYELRLAVDALTQPTYLKVPQIIDGEGRITRLRQDPLLTQLDDAIRGAMSGTAGATASTASTRSLVNSDALHQLTMISSLIIDWSAAVGAPQRRDPLNGLRAWHAAVLTLDIPRPWYTRLLRTWAGTIRAIVNPPKTRELEYPCPVCKASSWDDGEGSAGPFPLVQTYHPDAPTASANVRCRACGARWEGVEAMEELANELTEVGMT